MTSLSLVVHVDPEVDPERAERLVRRLRGELAELDVASVSPVAAGPPPERAKGADPVTLGASVVAFSAGAECSPRWSARCGIGSTGSPDGTGSR
jgi:hypothetical protein